ncbi:MAG TPA: hypothetical protein VEJ40_01535 [Pseudolabrys sp.]|nr:hypothetical protein [Pseudolabrys sp.]
MAAGPSRAQTATQTPPRWDVTAATDVRFFSWQSDRGFPTRASGQDGGSGEELYIPFAVQTAGRLLNPDFALAMLVRGGWVYAKQSSGNLSGEVAASTDTQSSATLTYYGWNGIQPFVSLATNLPTGRSSLPGAAANARMDPDLVDIATFGEGFNIGPVVGFNLPITPTLVATFSAGYTWRGPFDRENTLDATDPNVQSPASINPGNVLALSSALAYKVGNWVISLNGSVAYETKTFENGAPLYKPGNRYVGGAAAAYTWADTSVTTVTAAVSHTNHNQVLFTGLSDLATETMNTNSNLYRVGVDHLYALVKDQLYVGPLGTFLYRDHNGYNAGTLQFVPEKERWTAGGQLRFASSPSVVWNARAEHIWTREDDDPAPGGQRFSFLANAFVPGSAVPTVSSQGWQFVVGVNAKF